MTETAEKVVRLRVTTDTSSLAAGGKETEAALDRIGSTAKSAGDRASTALESIRQKMDAFTLSGGEALGSIRDQESALSGLASGVDRFGESEAAATARIESMVRASIEARTAAGGIVESQRSLAERASLSSDQVKRLNDELLASASSQARIRENVDLLNAAEARVARSTEDHAKGVRDEGAELSALLGRIDPTIAKLGQLDAMQERLKSFHASGALSGDDYAAYSAKIELARARIGGASEALSHLTLNSAAAKREVGYLAAEFARGDFTQFQGSLLTLANRTGLLSAAMSPLGLSILGVGAILAGFTALVVHGYLEQQRLEAALIATGNASGATSSQLLETSDAIGASTGRYSEASAAITALVASGKLAGDVLHDAGTAAVSLAELTGKSAEEAARSIEQLADNPSESLAKLNETYHFLTLAIYDQVKALEDEGRQEEATALAIKTAAEALDDRRAKVVENAGYIEQAWRKAKEAVSSFLEEVSQIGRTGTQAELASAQLEKARLDGIAENQALAEQGDLWAGLLVRLSGTRQGYEEARRANDAVLESLTNRLSIEKETAEQERKDHALQDNAIAARQAVDELVQSLDKQAKKQHEIQQLKHVFNALFEANASGTDPRLADVTRNADGGFSGGLYDELLAKINKRYEEHSKAAAAAARADREAASAMAQLEHFADSLGAKVGGPLDEAFAKYNLSIKRADELAEQAVIKGADVNKVIEAQNEAYANATAVRDEAIDKYVEESDVAGDALARMDAEIAARAQGAAALKAEQVVRSALAKAKKLDIDLSGEEIAQLRNSAKIRAEIAEGLDIAADLESPFEKLLEQIDRIKEAIEAVSDPLSDAFDPAKVEPLTKALDGLQHQMVVGIVQSSQDGLRSLQSMTTDGSRAFKALQIAIDALTVVQAISAVLNQGQGDPYTAFARMAAMAAAVAALGVDIGGFGGGGGPSSASAEVRQQTQGTGSVLGDADAKSESIANATEITANATSQLVGLNRGMLDALRSLQSALGAAGNQLARGAGDVQFAGVGSSTNLLDPFGQDALGGAIGNFLFGGSSKVIDEGIVIAGGALNDMLNQIVVGAYQTIHTSGGLFGGGGTHDQLVDVSDEFGKQFQLVIGSIVDTVRQGALALGLLPDDVEAAIAQFRVEEIRISLKGLSAEDQQKELEAVFSKIFDGLAGAVVPFIGQFQQVGEGLGETLVRVATEVQVTQEAFQRLGISVDQSDPEKFAQIADGLVQAAGGVDQFVAGMTAFVKNFAPEGQQFKAQTDALTSALSQAGLALPATRDGMWELMQSLDATTEEGRKQIAILLELADASDAYYDALEKQAKNIADYANFIAGLADEAGAAGSISGFQAARLQINAWEQETIRQANELAQAAGLQGASEEDLAIIHQVAAQRVAAAIRVLRQETADLVAQLGYYGTPSDQAANDAIGNWGDNAVDQIGRVDDAQRQLYDNQLRSIQSIQQYLDSMLLGDLSGLTPEQQIEEARRQLTDLQTRALAGDADGAAQLPQVADAFLRLVRGSEISGNDFNQQADWVRQLLQAVVDQGPTVPPPPEDTGAAGGHITSAYLDQRDQRISDQEAINRQLLAEQLVQHLHDLSQALNVPVLELAEQMHVPLMQLAEDLGIDLTTITSQSVEALAQLANDLGIPLGELVEGLGLTLPDLGDAIRGMTDQLGIDLTSLTGETAGQLADLAQSLGVNLSDLTESLGIDLGALTDINSPIFQALQSTVGEIGGDTSTELQPYLDAIASASGDEEANQAVKALRDHVDELAPDIRDQLAPFFDDILPSDPSDQLDYLSSITTSSTSMERTLRDARDLLGDISDFIKDANHAAGVPGYATGTGYVPSTGLALIHEAEAILPVPVASWFRREGIPVTAAPANDAAIGALRQDMQQLIRVVEKIGREQARVTQEEHKKDRQQMADGKAGGAVHRSAA